MDFVYGESSMAALCKCSSPTGKACGTDRQELSLIQAFYQLWFDLPCITVQSVWRGAARRHNEDRGLPSHSCWSCIHVSWLVVSVQGKRQAAGSPRHGPSLLWCTSPLSLATTGFPHFWPRRKTVEPVAVSMFPSCLVLVRQELQGFGGSSTAAGESGKKKHCSIGSLRTKVQSERNYLLCRKC